MSRKRTDHGTTPMFDLPTGGGLAPEPKQRLRTIVSGKCPQCVNQGKKVGLVRDGQHLIWRVHWVKTFGSTSRLCHASGAPLCENSAIRIPGETTPTCPCETTTTETDQP